MMLSTNLLSLDWGIMWCSARYLILSATLLCLTWVWHVLNESGLYTIHSSFMWECLILSKLSAPCCHIYSITTQSSASMSAWDASHPICTPDVPTNAIAMLPIASCSLLIISPDASLYDILDANSMY